MTEQTDSPEGSDPFPSGTVLRWTAKGRYSFAALRCDNKLWYLTGGAGMFGTSMKTFSELLELLEEPSNEIADLLVAVAWEEV